LLGRISGYKRQTPDGQRPEKAEDAEALDVYQRELRARGWVDFDDLILLPLELLRTNADLVQAHRSRYRWVSVDEYQDIDGAQYELVKLLVPADGNLCAIGDPDQAIYGFRGADVAYFQRFHDDFPGGRTVCLTRNYRSTQTIVDAALQLIAPASLLDDRQLVAHGLGPEQVEIHACSTDRAEAEFVVHTIERLLGGSTFFSLDSSRVDTHEGESLSFADFAVLYRTEAQADALVEALHRSGMPFQRRSHYPLADQPLVQTVVHAMVDHQQESPAEASVLERLELAAANLPEPDKEAEACLVALRSLAARHSNDRITLLTFHASKGLEFPVVFLVGCEDGVLPLHWGGTPDEQSLAEERRLFFVGMTRAQQRLILTHAHKRPWRGKVREQAPSPFLDDIQRQLLAFHQHRATKKPVSTDRQQTLFD
jgi:superfamily I DNA/RNA helicase